MIDRNATALGGVMVLMGALLALLALLTLPAAAGAADGGANANSGGGATYQPPPEAGPISLALPSRAWVGRATRIRGAAEELAGRTISIERRNSPRKRWRVVASVPVRADGRFALRWKPRTSGRHELRARPAPAAGAEARAARQPSATTRLMVYRRVRTTWYGPGLYGNRTACGQRLTKRTIRVAHRTLPCGTRVALRARGRSTVVRVIDRGPFVRGIAYDLTSATATRLGVRFTSRIGAAVLNR